MSLKLAPQRVNAERKGDVWYLSSSQELHEPPQRLGDLLRRGAASAPERDFLLERRAGVLERTTWKQALDAAEGIADWLVREHPRDVRVASLSGNSVDLALLMLGCHLAGVPFVPISPAYSLLSQDFAKLRVVLDKVKPGIVFVDRPEAFERAIESSGLRGRATILYDLRPLEVRRAGRELRVREAEIQADDVAKILFTSGSTGFPKGVLNTHRMLCANQQMIAQCWPFLTEGAPPILVDWLPWSHTFGGNHDFNMVLFHGGTLLVDEGRPTTTGIDATVANLRELPPTLYFNVPAGYAALVPKLEADEALARAFFLRLDVMFYAAAALPPDLWRRLTTLAVKWTEREVFMTTAWGSTETSPMATSTHFHVPSAGNIGLPAPGVTLKLVPSGNKTEVRVKGPSVMPGYLDEPELTRRAFDDEGFYLMGDAVRFVDPERPEAGIAFDGRVAEDFKLSSGTWVSVTHVRTGVVAKAGGLLTDVVVCGHDRESLGLLAWPSIAGCRTLAGGERPLSDLATDSAVKNRMREIIAAWNADNPGSSMKVSRVILLGEAPSSDAGEITDKGYTNQRACLDRRSADVDELFADPPSARVQLVG